MIEVKGINNSVQNKESLCEFDFLFAKKREMKIHKQPYKNLLAIIFKIRTLELL